MNAGEDYFGQLEMVSQLQWETSMQSQVGTVVAVNQRKGMFIVEIRSGSFAVFEILEGIDIAVGDRVQGDLHALGGETLVHVTQGRSFSAYGQSGPSSRAACDRLL